MIGTDWRFTLFIPVFVAIVWATRYVSLGSMFVVFLYPVFLAIAKIGDPYYVPMVIIACLFTASGVFSHRQNIKRLLNGTERKLGQKVEIPTENGKEEKEKTV